jgi:hypothetical protein
MKLQVPPSLSAASASLPQISQLLQERYVPILPISRRWSDERSRLEIEEN